MTKRRTLLAKLALWVVALTLIFGILDYCGLWDRLRGLDDIDRTASSIDKENEGQVGEPRVFEPGYLAWKPLLRLIRKYSRVPLPPGVPVLVAAVEPETPIFAHLVSPHTRQEQDWEVPSTTLLVLFTTDYRLTRRYEEHSTAAVGTTSDLRRWAAQDRADFRSRWVDVGLGSATLLIAWLQFRQEKKEFPVPV